MSPNIENLINRYELLYNSIRLSPQAAVPFPGSDKLKAEYGKISNAVQADAFFAEFGVGNAFVGRHVPFERMNAYELLLEILMTLDKEQYHSIHKGSPFYFIGWTAYQYNDFAKAVFYMDAAVSEDLKSSDVQNKISVRPSLEFFLLKYSSNPSGIEIHQKNEALFNELLQDYRNSSGSTFTTNEFSDKFVVDLIYNGAQGRSLLTAFYTFVLDYREIKKQILLRSDTGGSIQPFLDHLFDGARILESLLEKGGGVSGTLRPKITGIAALQVSPAVLLRNQSLADAVDHHNDLTASGNSFQDINFGTAFIIRNTTGHSLLWQDQFPDASSYELLFKSLTNSILYTIEKLWP